MLKNCMYNMESQFNLLTFLLLLLLVFGICSALEAHNYTVDWLFDQMKYLGHLIDFDATAANEYMEFQNVLDNFAYNKSTGLYDPTDIMHDVSIKRAIRSCCSYHIRI